MSVDAWLYVMVCVLVTSAVVIVLQVASYA